MNGRQRNETLVRREGGALSVVKDQEDREKALAARARQRAIGRELRRMYDEVVQEAVPEDFFVILKKIDETKDRKGNA